MSDIYVVTMYRWGNKENHSYPLGVYTTLDTAKREGDKELDYRGGKYYPEVTQHIVDHELKEDKDGFWIQDGYRLAATRCNPAYRKQDKRQPDWLEYPHMTLSTRDDWKRQEESE